MSRKTKAAEFLDDVFNVTVTGRNLHVTDAIKDYVLDRIAKIERFSQRIIDVVVTVEVQKVEHRADIVMKVDNTKIKSQGNSDNLYASIDMAFDKLETQLLKYKDKIQDHHAKGTKVIDMDVNVLSADKNADILEINDQIEEENSRRLMDRYSAHKVVSKEKRPLKMLTDGEALMKMDLSGDPFLIYRCEETQNLKIMYRRKDGNFGVIEPKA